jgi:hypothetical protein
MNPTTNLSDPKSRGLDFVTNCFQDRNNSSLKHLDCTHKGYLVAQYNHLALLQVFNIYDTKITPKSVGDDVSDDSSVEVTNATIKFPFVNFIKFARSSSKRTYFLFRNFSSLRI